MKIFAIMLVKNEADIVASVLKDAEKWADKIFILDNGSTDGTWEIINSLKDDVITPWKQDFGAYHNGLRADVYNEFKDLAQPGDWWCFKLDADEFYYDNPREFIYKLQKKDGLVAKKSLDYYLCEEDCTSYNFTGNFEKDRTFIKHVRNSCWAEPRFFKETGNIKWESKPENHYPSNCGRLSRQYIMVKHYQFRSPQQMQKRLDVRNASEAKKQGLAFRHVKETNWQELLKPRSELVFDDGKRETYDLLPIRNSLKKSLSNIMISKMKSVLHRVLNKTFSKFLMVGVINTIIGDGIMFLLFNCFHFSYWISSASNYVVGGISSYILNKIFTFKNFQKNFTQIIYFIINLIICYMIAFKISKTIFTHILIISSSKLSDNLALLTGTILYTFLNYFGQKIFVFSNKNN